jgi:predicted extracellular nuclease
MRALHPRFLSANGLSICGLLLAAGCVKPKTNGTDSGDGDGGSAGGTTVYDIQSGAVEDGAAVTLNGVIATTGLTIEGAGFYVQDAGGGEYSGIYVFLQGTFTDLNFSVGDELSISGEVTEFYDFTELTVTAETGITVTGRGAATTTPVSGTPSDWEPYEGVLVDLADQTAEACPDSYGETALSAGIELNDDLYVYDTERGATYSSIVGVVSYSFSEWKLNPRSADDLVGYTPGEGCTSSIASLREDGVEGAVELEGVVATSGWDLDEEGFFVQDEGGGPNSGIYVWLGKSNDGSLDVQPGDLLDIQGSAVDYYDFLELSVRSVDAIQVVGASSPVATVLSETPSDWEPYEGALVTLEDVTATSSLSSYGECDTDWGIVLDDWTYHFDASNGTHWDSVTGNVVYSYEEWKLAPRSQDDLAGQEGGSDEPVAATVADVQSGTVAEDTTVRIEGAVVTAGMTLDGEGFFVQDEGGGAYSGVYVFTEGAVDVAVGDVVTVTGEVTEYYDLTEISAAPEDVVVTGSASPVATVLGEAPADWEPYEGVLLTLEGIALSADADSYGTCATDWDGLSVDDALYDYDAAHGAGDAFSTLSGPLTWSFGAWKLLPRSAADLVE